MTKVSLPAMWLCSVLAASSAVFAAPQDVPLTTVLERLGGYIDRYERELSAVVSEEHYLQETAGRTSLWPASRVLKSDFLITRGTSEGDGPAWVAFRDVFEVDGKPVQDRSDRLVQLFLAPSGDAGEQINRIVTESAKYNLGWVTRTINVPTMVLHFGRSAEQHRSQFRRGGLSRIADREAREVRFTERTTPRVIQTPDQAAAQGAFWVDEETGRVFRTELRVTTGSTSLVIGVSYSHDVKLDMWLPTVMTERYATPRQPVITGRAVYQNFRKFDVSVGTIIKTQGM